MENGVKVSNYAEGPHLISMDFEVLFAKIKDGTEDFEDFEPGNNFPMSQHELDVWTDS